jgi:hypothetical protein
MKTGTHVSDLNELACGYFLNREKWWSPEVEAQFREKARLVRLESNSTEVMTQVERGRAQAERLRIHIIETGYTLVGVEWVSRPGALQKILPWASVNHPADMLVVINGTLTRDRHWLGVSLKSRSGAAGSGLKNPGLGTVESALSVELKSLVHEAVGTITKLYQLPESQDARKKAIRADLVHVAPMTRAMGTQVLQDVRNRILGALTVSCSQEMIRSFLTQHLLDCGTEILPKYVRLTGTGNLKDGFTAEVHDPYRVNLTGPLTVVAIGNDTIGFQNNGARVCLLRAKFESEKLASTLKFSVDVWE